MKTKFKVLLCCLMILPCLLVFTGCGTKDISALDYFKTLQSVGNNYLESHSDSTNFDDFTISSTQTRKSTYKVEFEVGSETKTYEDTEEVTNLQTYTFKNVGSELHIEVTEEITSKQLTHSLDSDTNTVTSKETITVETKIETLEKNADSYIQTLQTTVKEDGVVDDSQTEKEYYVFSSKNDYVSAVDAAIEKVNEYIEEQYSPDIAGIPNMEVKYYTQGNVTTQQFDYVDLYGGSEFSLSTIQGKTSLKGNNFHEITMSLTESSPSNCTDLTQTMSFSYNATGDISTDITDFELVYYMSDIDVPSM